MSNLTDTSVEMLPLKESLSISYSCKDEYLKCPEGVNHQEVTSYGSTSLTSTPPQGIVTETGKRVGVIPLFRDRIREGSLRIRDKGRRRKEQKQEHTENAKCLQQQDARGGKEFPLITKRRNLVAQKNRYHGNRFDSEFDISDALARSKVPALRTKKLVTGGYDTVHPYTSLCLFSSNNYSRSRCRPTWCLLCDRFPSENRS